MMAGIMRLSDNARKQLEDILSRSEYQAYQQPPRSWFEIAWDKAKAWIGEWLEGWFPSFSPSDQTASTVLIAVIILILALIWLFVWKGLRRIKRNSMYRQQREKPGASRLHWTFEQHVLEAKRQEQQGDYRAAVRHLFSGVLLYFQGQRWLDIHVWKTNGEYADELRRVHPDEAALFSRCARLFDRVTYGGNEIHADEYRQLREQVMDRVGEQYES